MKCVSWYPTNGAVSFIEYCLFAYRLRESLVYVAPQICKQTILKKMKIETHVSKEKCPKTLIFRKFYLNHTEVRLPKEFFYVEANVFFFVWVTLFKKWKWSEKVAHKTFRQKWQLRFSWLPAILNLEKGDQTIRWDIWHTKKLA